MTRFRPVALLLLSVGCALKDPEPSPKVDGGPGTNALGFCEPKPSAADVLTGCQAKSDDYRPRDSGSSADSWPACISDDNRYHPINPSITTVSRVAAFDEIAGKLWEGDRVPTAQEFVEARVIYAQDQGLDSRVQRREDVHYPAPPQPCSTAGIPADHPDRCVGPSKLLPVLNDAFAKGSQGEMPLVQAARIEAALLWFLYISALSEVTSCTTRAQDCDSAWAYYSGGTERAAPAGLSRYVKALSEETHQRAYDATLAVRCWRNLDQETGTATDVALRDRARAQLDRATLRGVALIARQRFTELLCSKDEVLAARWAFLQTLVPLLDRAARELDAVEADALKAQISAAGPQLVDVPAALRSLDTLFPCP
jgi:hypothetical protein